MAAMAVDRFLHPFARPAKDDFVSIVRGEGAMVYDGAGNAYVDAMASLWYCNIGHGRADMADAVAKQVRTLEAYSCFDPFTNPPADELADLLATWAPVADPRVFFTSSGSEAVDSAIKLARIAQVQAGHPERTLIVSRTFGYHGVTYGGLSAQGLPPNQAGFGPLLPDFVNLPNHDLEAMANLFAERGDEIAAVITEPVQGAGGVRPPLPGYLEGLRRLCDQHGAFLIMDEVICAFGRLGHMFASEFYGVRPDLDQLRQGRDVRVRAARRCGGGRRRARAAGGRCRLLAPARPHLLGSPHGVRRRARSHGHHRARGPARAVEARR